MISNPDYKLLGRQVLSQQRVVMGGSVDFSDQKEFGGIATFFRVERAGSLAPPDDYTIEDGIITFHRAGNYNVLMANAAIVSSILQPAFVVAPVNVIDFTNFVAVTVPAAWRGSGIKVLAAG